MSNIKELVGQAETAFEEAKSKYMIEKTKTLIEKIEK